MPALLRPATVRSDSNLDLHPVSASWPTRYPPQPVLSCPLFRPTEGEQGDDRKLANNEFSRRQPDESLADQQCIPCRGGVPPTERIRAEELLRELDDGWRLNADGHLDRTYSFENFVKAMAFANKVADIAESERHHPDLHIAWGRCTVEIWTHKIRGLTESDFYFAAKADRAFSATWT